MGINHSKTITVTDNPPAGGAGSNDWNADHVTTAVDLTEQSSTPSAPGSGKRQVFAGPDGLYEQTSGGLLLPVGYGLDHRALHATYGDHYPGPSLDAKWTRQNRGSSSYLESFLNSWLVVPQNSGGNFGDVQAYTDHDEIEVAIAASSFIAGAGEGFGPLIVDSSGTGLWFGFRETSRLGLFAVTTWVVANEPVYNWQGASAPAGSQYLGSGRKVWMSILKRKTFGTDMYTFRASLDGNTYGVYQLPLYTPTAFTPAYVGWFTYLAGSITPYGKSIRLDWFDVVEANLSANRLITPTSGTVTWSSDATGVTGTLSQLSDGSVANEVYFPSSNSAGVSFLATWSVAQTINRVRLNTRNDFWGVGWIETSDGTRTPFFAPSASKWIAVDLPAAVSTTTLKIGWSKFGYGANPGFHEIEAYLAS